MEWNEFFEFAFNNRRTFFYLTAIQCLIFAFIILIPSYKKHFSGVRRWANLFASTFLVLGLMYLIKYLNIRAGYPNDTLTETIRFVLSGLSNLTLFLTTIFIRKDFFNIKLFSKKMFAELFKGWQGVVFIIIILSSILAASVKLSNNETVKTILEIPDHLASSFVLLGFGYTIYRELAFRRSPVFAVVALFAIVAYAGSFIFQGFHLLDLDITSNWYVAPGRVAAAVTLVTFFLKAGLFFPTYFLITSTSNEFRKIHELLEEITTDRVEFLESEGILKKIKESFKADAIILTILLPGQTRSLISTYQFPSTDIYIRDPQRKPEITIRTKNNKGFEKQICEQVFNDNKVLTHNVHNYSDNLNPNLQIKVKKLEINEELKLNEKVSGIAVPIRYHGAVIGSLEIYLNTSNFIPSFSRTDVLHLQRIAVLLTRVVQANREIAGLDQLITRLGSLQTDQTDLSTPIISKNSLDEMKNNRIDPSKMSPKKALKNMLIILNDLFSPLAVGIYTDIGFKTELQVFPEENQYSEDLKNNLEGFTPENLRDSRIIPIYNNLTVPSFENFRFVRTEEYVLKNEKERVFGQIIALIPEKNDKFDSPTLFTYHLFIRVISNIVVDNYLDFARHFLNSQLKDLSVKLNTPENNNISTWVNIIEKKISSVNLSLLAVTFSEKTKSNTGKYLSYVTSIQNNSDIEIENEEITLYKDPLKIDKKYNRIIRIELKKSEGFLWFGVERKKFGSEIKDNYKTSPWKSFLINLADITDASLFRIIDKDERELYRKEAIESQGLATTAITLGTFLHQIGNQVKDLTHPIDNLKSSLNLGILRGTKDSWQRVLGLTDSLKKLKELSQLLSGVVKADGHRPCQLDEIINESRKLIDGSLEQYNIIFENKVSPKLLSTNIDVPFYVAYFALLNLVMNAKDSIKINKIEKGIIKIEVEENEKSLIIHIVDNGSGVPKEIQKKIFEKGFSTKTDIDNSSTGLGLYFTSRTLRENGAVIKLTNPGPNPPTKFTIIFPKPRKEIL